MCGGLCYAAGPEGNDLPKAEVKVSGDNHNTLSINNSTFNVPDSVDRGLTHVGTGAAIAAGLKAGGSIAKTSGLSPTAKIGILAGAIIGGTTTVGNITSSILG